MLCQGSQKRDQTPLDLEMQKVVSYSVGAGNQTRVSERASEALSHWAIFPAPCLS